MQWRKLVQIEQKQQRYKVKMITIALIAEKGGAGKSTLAANIAAGLKRRGHTVTLIDADPQATLADWSAIVDQHDLLPAVTVPQGRGIEAIKEAIKQAETDFVVIDAPGRAGTLTDGIVRLADVALIPVRPSAPDVWATRSIAESIQNKRDAGLKIEAAFVVNSVKPGTRLAAEFVNETWNKQGHIPMLKTTIGDRTAFAVAMAQGLTVYDITGAKQAQQDIDNLLTEIGA